MARRVKVQYTTGESLLGTKLLTLPATTEEFFVLVRQRFEISLDEPLQMRVDEADVDDLEIIRDDDTVVVSRVGDALTRKANGSFSAPPVAALSFYPQGSFPSSGTHCFSVTKKKKRKKINQVNIDLSLLFLFSYIL